AIGEICNRVDGLPLAIELAAARTRLLQPTQLLARMGKSLDMLNKGQKDLPERQQTLRSAIAWSYDLLDEPAKRAFRTLGIFKRSWTLEAADALFEALKLSGDVEALTEQLLDVSLIKPVLVSHASEPRFNMLQTVHEYANEMLAESGELEEVRMAFAQYFLTLVSQSEDQLWGLNSEPWFDKIEYEYQNIRASFNAFVDHKNYEGAWKMFYLVHMFWHARGGLGEVDLWKERAKIEPSLEQSDPAIMAIDKSVKAKAYMWMAYCDFFLFHIQGGLEKLHRAEEFFRELGDQGNLAIALSMDGGYGVYCNTPDFEEKLMEAEAIIRSGDYVLAKCFLFTWAIEYYRLKGEIETVEARIKEAKQLSTLYEMPLIRFFTTIVKLTEMYNSNSDYERMAAECKSAIDAFPEKSYKSSRGSLMGGCAMCLLLQGRIEESLDWFVPAMELILESGDKEAYYHGVIGSIIYFMHVNRPDISVKCMGALDHFIEVAHYPMSGQTKLEYDFAGSFLEPLKTDARYTEWYALGQRLSLDQAFRLAFSQMQTDAKSVA
ncbi:MAG: hypothetical protein JNM00_16120, partial [Flavobacteriales bacterium]|nr:hypothetical protein [Flavobacteriales bacterium]